MGDFKWSTDFNFARNVNEITDLQDQVIEGGYLNRAVEGEAIGVFFGPEYAGVDPDNGDALYSLNTENADGSLSRETTNDVSEAQRVVIGDPNPDFIGGITNNFSYAGVELSVFFQGVFGNDIYNGGGKFQSANADFFDNQTRDQLNRWQQPGDITNVPRIQNGVAGQQGVSSQFLFDASYLNVKNITLSYSIPQSLAGRLRLTRLQVYGSVDNAYLFTSKKGMDPQRAFNGTSDASYPPFRTVTFGVNVNL